MSIIFHGAPISQPSRSVRFLLEENNIPHEFKVYDILKGETRSEEYLKNVNSEGQVPVIVDPQIGNLHLTEGAAILIHLSETRKLDKWYPADHKTRALINKFLHWHHSNTRNGTLKLLVPFLQGKPLDYLPEYKVILKKLDGYLTTPYLAGDHITIADLLILPEIDQLEVLKIVNYDEFPHIKRWLGSVRGGLKTYEANTAVLHGFAKSKGL